VLYDDLGRVWRQDDYPLPCLGLGIHDPNADAFGVVKTDVSDFQIAKLTNPELGA